MIGSIDALKSILGIPLADASQDASLTLYLESATEWVQGQTHRRFDVPILATEYRTSPGERLLYLNGHVDDSIAADNASVDLDPTTSVSVERRPLAEPYRPWEALVGGEDWERREDSLLFLRAWSVWPSCDEYRIRYLDGYAVAPADVTELVLELASNSYLMDQAIASGTAGITSEKLGDFSYSADGTMEGSSSISDKGTRTLNYRTRKFV